MSKTADDYCGKTPFSINAQLMHADDAVLPEKNQGKTKKTPLASFKIRGLMIA
ncbi:MAG: hypothetical protein ACTTJZ_07650 [Sphaerochaetaceae bacterium]